MGDHAGYDDITSPLEEHRWVLIIGEPLGVSEVSSTWRSRGHEVFACRGPAAGHTCPIVGGGSCPVVAVAPTVVNCLDRTNGDAAALFSELEVRYPEVVVLHTP